MKHRVVRWGIWLYARTAESRVFIVELDYDYWFEMAKAEGALERADQPSLNAEGRQYYVCFRPPPAEPPLWVDSPGHDSIELASEYAQSKVPGPITWR